MKGGRGRKGKKREGEEKKQLNNLRPKVLGLQIPSIFHSAGATYIYRSEMTRGGEEKRMSRGRGGKERTGEEEERRRGQEDRRRAKRKRDRVGMRNT